MDIVHAQAPGKILWLGGYAVLERPSIGFVTTVDSFVHVTAAPLQGDEVVVERPQRGRRVAGRISPGTGSIDMEVPQELILLKTAAEMATKYAAALGFKASGLSLTSTNDPAISYTVAEGRGVVKAGLGSSAAVTVAAIAAILKLYGIDSGRDDALHKLAQMAHSVATGKIGSGFDVAAATYGSIVYTRYTPDIVRSLPKEYDANDVLALVKRPWDYSITRVAMPAMLGPVVAGFVNESASTVSLVSKVFEFKARDPDRYSRIISGIDATSRAAAKALGEINKGRDVEHNLEAFRTNFEKGRELTKLLGTSSGAGIEPDECTALVEDSKGHGAFVAKLPGSGGRDSVAALCVDDEARARLEEFWGADKRLVLLNVKDDNGGHRVEVESK